jgi:hypothetical protein
VKNVSGNVMKILPAIIIQLLVANLTMGQSSLFKKWIGEQNETLILTSKHATYSYFDAKYQMLQHDSLLIFKDHEDTIRYRVIHLTSDSLTVTPIGKRTLKLTSSRETYRFHAAPLFDKKTFVFQKIYFSGTSCYGDCPDMKVDIDSTGHFYFQGNYKTGDFHGLYEGQLTSKQLDKLVVLIKKSQLN